MSANGKNAKSPASANKPGGKRPAATAGKKPAAANQPRQGAPSRKGKPGPTQEERRRREIAGIALIALGLFLALTHLGPAGVLGEKISGFTFGLTGVFAYVLPVILIGQGIYAIATAGKTAALPRFMLIVAVVLMILSFIHVFFVDRVESEGYIDFLWGSFALGESVATGGGILGGLLAYPAVALLGKGGSYVLFPALALTLIVALTNISLQKTSAKVGKVIKQNVAAVSTHFEQIKEAKKEKQEQQRLNTEELSITGGFSPKKTPQIPESTPEMTEKSADSFGELPPAAVDGVDLLPEKGRLTVKVDPETEPIRPSTFRRTPILSEQAPQEPVLPRYTAEKHDVQQYVKTVLSETDGRYQPGASDLEGEEGVDVSAAPANADLFVEPIDQRTAETEPADADDTQELIKELASRDFGEYEKYLPPLTGFEQDAPPATLGEVSFEMPHRLDQADPFEGILADSEPSFQETARERPGRVPKENTFDFFGERAAALSQDAPKTEKPVETPPAAPQPAAHAAADQPCYVPPPISLLSPPKSTGVREDPMLKAKLLEQALASFGISAKVTDVVQGPVITRYELQPAPGVRVNRITNLSDDIALHLAAPRVRIQAPIPGKSVIGIEVPNKVNAMVALREVIASPEFQSAKSPLAIALGKDISGKLAMADIAKMPHLLIAGSTGSGKSVCINSIICSIIYHAPPEDVRMIMIDPKVVELSVFSNIPHLLVPVVTEPKQAAGALRWAVNEMIQRYNQFKQKGARELTRYNELITAEGKDKLPAVVVIVDELADLMMVAPDDVEDSICRIAQLGRAAGIHLVVATQRPSADVITGLIKANILTRIAFAVASSTDSRIILDSTGAEKLLGKGDMLFSNGGGTPQRIQGALVTDVEVEKIHQYFEANKGMGTIDENISETIASGKMTGADSGGGADFEDDMLAEAVEVFLGTGQASISMLQRRLRVGYNRAARLIDIMEQMGIVSGFEGSKPRKLLIGRAQFEELFGRPPNLPDLGA